MCVVRTPSDSTLSQSRDSNICCPTYPPLYNPCRFRPHSVSDCVLWRYSYRICLRLPTVDIPSTKSAIPHSKWTALSLLYLVIPRVIRLSRHLQGLLLSFLLLASWSPLYLSRRFNDVHAVHDGSSGRRSDTVRVSHSVQYDQLALE